MIDATKETRENKIAFILSCRANRRMSDTFYQHLVSEYKKMQDDELNIEFNYYLNK